MKKVLITGSLGQIGSALTTKLREVLGVENVIATDLRRVEGNSIVDNGHFEVLDVMEHDSMLQLCQKYEVDTLIHLAALLSATAEAKPQLGWSLNMGGLVNCLEVSRELRLTFFTPSSIAAFGPSSPKDNTPQDTIQRPTSMYGVTKVAGELLCDYYFEKYGVDTRGIRFPGLISYEAEPGGGTTDYAVDMFYQALRHQKYTSYIKEQTYMDMMYMPDAIDATIQLLQADSSKLIHRNAFNITAMSFAPEDLANSIQKYIPSFTLEYRIDPTRQGIADSWPNSIDSSAATKEWGFKPTYDLDKMTQDMLEKLSKKLEIKLKEVVFN